MALVKHVWTAGVRRAAGNGACKLRPASLVPYARGVLPSRNQTSSFSSLRALSRWARYQLLALDEVGCPDTEAQSEPNIKNGNCAKKIAAGRSHLCKQPIPPGRDISHGQIDRLP